MDSTQLSRTRLPHDKQANDGDPAHTHVPSHPGTASAAGVLHGHVDAAHAAPDFHL